MRLAVGAGGGGGLYTVYSASTWRLRQRKFDIVLSTWLSLAAH